GGDRGGNNRPAVRPPPGPAPHRGLLRLPRRAPLLRPQPRPPRDPRGRILLLPPPRRPLRPRPRPRRPRRPGQAAQDAHAALFQMDDSGAAADGQGATRPPDAKDPGASEADHPGGGGGGGRKWKGASWLRAILPRRGTRRRGTKEEEEEEEPSRPSGAVDPHPGDAGGGPSPSPPLVERRASFRRSCEWMICREPPPGGRGGSSMDPPRHSWDGSMVGRAFACSFACLDEPPDGVTRVRQGNAEESAREHCSREQEWGAFRRCGRRGAEVQRKEKLQ
uniref:Uncharacterized protein n=1 Tax=Aegilops tauschii subsp. strangulata TaxID=200361 RepID=A0A453J081_AEGTS